MLLLKGLPERGGTDALAGAAAFLRLGFRQCCRSRQFSIAEATNGHQIHITFKPEQLQPLLEQVAEVFSGQQQGNAAALVFGTRLAFTEEEAAEMLGLAEHVLRDERLRGRIGASKVVGARIRYKRQDLDAYLQGRRYVPKGSTKENRPPGPLKGVG